MCVTIGGGEGGKREKKNRDLPSEHKLDGSTIFRSLELQKNKKRKSAATLGLSTGSGPEHRLRIPTSKVQEMHSIQNARKKLLRWVAAFELCPSETQNFYLKLGTHHDQRWVGIMSLFYHYPYFSHVAAARLLSSSLFVIAVYTVPENRL